MYFQIVPMRDRGVAKSWEQIRREKPIRGDVNIRHEMCKIMNRTSNIATIRPAMPLDPELLPPLLDAFLSGMATNAFTLSGIEEVDGRLYSQSWYCRPD
jgi:hypothetical protein